MRVKTNKKYSDKERKKLAKAITVAYKDNFRTVPCGPELVLVN